MTPVKIIALFIGFWPLAFAANARIESPNPNYTLREEIKFGGEGGWDCLTADPALNELFVSHASKAVVIDLAKKNVIGEIPDSPGIHAIALAPESGLGFTTNGKENSVGVFDLKTLKPVRKILVGENPDLILYDPQNRQVYVFNGKSKNVSVLNEKSTKAEATIGLPGKPEFPVLDQKNHRIFVNVEDLNEVAVIDTKTAKVREVISLAGCESPSGIAYDPKTGHLFVVCENAKMVMVDPQSKKILSSVATGKGTDGLAYDPQTRLLFAPNGQDGTLTVVKNEGASLKVLQNVKTMPGARTIALNSSNHEVYLPTSEFQTLKPGEKRPKPIDGTQKVLVFAPSSGPTK